MVPREACPDRQSADDRQDAVGEDTVIDQTVHLSNDGAIYCDAADVEGGLPDSHTKVDVEAGKMLLAYINCEACRAFAKSSAPEDNMPEIPPFNGRAWCATFNAERIEVNGVPHVRVNFPSWWHLSSDPSGNSATFEVGSSGILGAYGHADFLVDCLTQIFDHLQFKMPEE